MTLIAILIATLAAGIGSVWAAALLMRMGLGGRHDGVGPQHLLSLAAGALLATAFMHLLPEAFESQAGAHDLFATLLVGVVFFFLLDKAELWHHGHEHSHAEPAGASGSCRSTQHTAARSTPAGWRKTETGSDDPVRYGGKCLPQPCPRHPARSRDRHPVGSCELPPARTCRRTTG